MTTYSAIPGMDELEFSPQLPGRFVEELCNRWINRRKWFQVHFTPRLFVAQYGRALHPRPGRKTPPPRGVFRNVEELLESIGEFIDNHNRQPKPFIWTAKASDILERVKRGQALLA
jgi:hypothetical protein